MVKGTEARPCGSGRTGFHRAVDHVLEESGTATWALSATDLTFLWDECRRCFYKKVALGQPRPRAPFSKVFSLIDRAMKAVYIGERAEGFVPGMAPGVIGGGDRWVKSAPIVPPESNSACFIRGRVDVLVDCDDGTVAIVDFKTSEPGLAAVQQYSRQLHAYALGLEHPARGPATTVSALGLLCFEPDAFEAGGARAALLGDLVWVEVERDDEAFFGFLTEVVSVLEHGEAPAAAADCPWCAWQADGRVAA